MTDADQFVETENEEDLFWELLAKVMGGGASGTKETYIQALTFLRDQYEDEIPKELVYSAEPGKKNYKVRRIWFSHLVALIGMALEDKIITDPLIVEACNRFTSVFGIEGLFTARQRRTRKMEVDVGNRVIDCILNSLEA